MLKFVTGDLLSVDCTYICHQCNCVTSCGKGLSFALFQKFPYADIYKERKEKSAPGHIIVKGDGRKERFVVNMMAQYYPGPAKYSNDSTTKRLQWFQDCLDEMSCLATEHATFAFPYKIGCGLAGGSWDEYLHLIQMFQKKHNIIVLIVKNS